MPDAKDKFMSTRMLFLLLFPLITLTRCESSAVREIREKSNRDHDRLLAMRFPPRGVASKWPTWSAMRCRPKDILVQSSWYGALEQNRWIIQILPKTMQVSE